jgi:hypothetical protein
MERFYNFLYRLTGYDPLTRPVQESACSCAFASHMVYGKDAMQHVVGAAIAQRARMVAHGIDPDRATRLRNVFTDTARAWIKDHVPDTTRYNES